MFSISSHKKNKLPAPHEALPGRQKEMTVAQFHFVNGSPMSPPFPSHLQMAMFGMGCFWGAERRMWQVPGVFVTAVGYAGGFTPNPTYEEVCTGMTGHNEVVRVIFDPGTVEYDQLLKIFWEAHDPTQGMRQGNDIGTQYRSGIYVYDEQQRASARTSQSAYRRALAAADRAPITTEILSAPAFYYAEDYHQQYLAKNPGGYCGLGGTGVALTDMAFNA